MPTLSQVNMDLDAVIEWRPPFEQNIKENDGMEQKAAERLAKYINEGKFHAGRTGQKPILGVVAKAVESGDQWAVEITIDASITMNVQYR